MTAVRRVAVLASLLAASASACASPEPPVDPALERHIRTRIAALETLRGPDLEANIEMLGVYMGDGTTRYLVDALRGDPSPRVRAGCAQALGRRQDPGALPALAAAAVEDPNEGVRYTAAYNLCLHRDPRGLPILIAALRSEDPINRRLANQGLEALTGLDFGYDPMEEPGKRETAAARWEGWWEATGPDRAAAGLLVR